jgi:anti-anti-sigma factor
MKQRPFSYELSELSEAGQTLTLHGELDEAASAGLRDLLRVVLADLDGDLRLDLADVDFLPSVAVGVLAAAQGAAAKQGASITFVAAKGTIAQRVLTICGLAHEEV